MSFQRVIIKLFVLGACISSLRGARAVATEINRPNFVIILADDLGYGDLGCYEGWIKTPRIDRLAEQGIRFTDFHSSGHVCSPTRAGLLTGRYQQRAGIPGVVYANANQPSHRHGLQDVEVTFAELLQEQGYATGVMGKWHLGYDRPYNPVRHGFTVFRGYVSGNVDYVSHVDQVGRYDWWHNETLNREFGYTTHLITHHAVQFIAENRERPFCLYVAHEAPHYPFQGPADPPERIEGGDGQWDRSDTNRIRHAYTQMVEELDRGVGDILDALNRWQLSDRTLVFFCSDNGATAFGSNGPLRGHKGTHWEGGHRVPAIARWPTHIEAGQTADELAITLDIMPTMLELAGVEMTTLSRPLDGVSLTGMWSTRTIASEPRQLHWNGKAMRDGKWKVVVSPVGEAELFDLATDLSEQRDVSGMYPERVERMLEAIERWQSDVSNGATAQP